MGKTSHPALGAFCVVVMFSAVLCPQQPKLKDAAVSSTPSRVDLPPAEADSRVVHRVPPEYPENARKGHIEGPVTVRVLVGNDGSVEKVTPLRGNPFLLMSAMNAIKQWRYRPYVLNGAHVEFESSVTLKFAL